MNWNSNIRSLIKTKKVPDYINLLESAGVNTLNDLKWIFPLHLDLIPSVASFDNMEESKLFKGEAKIVSFQSRKNFNAKRRSRYLLQTLVATIKDLHSNQMAQVTFFNAYPTMVKKFSSLKKIKFWGTPSVNQARWQFIYKKINFS